MELKNWSYDEFPAFDEAVDDATWLDTTGNEPGTTLIHDVEYCRVNDTPLKLQILVPECRNHPFHNADDGKRYPCVIFVKGSGWYEQNLHHALGNLARLARRGYVVAEVEYRHAGIAPFPAPIVDARNAVRFMRVHASEYRVDPDNIIMAGDSSGGHTAAYAGILHNDDDPEQNLFPGVSAEVKGIINQYGSTDFLFEDSDPSTPSHNLPESPEGREMGGADMRAQPELAEKLTVRSNIFPDTPIAPMLILHGTKDRIVNCRCSVNLYRRLTECSKDASLYLLRGADHGGAEFWSDAVLDIEEAFIRRCLGMDRT